MADRDNWEGSALGCVGIVLLAIALRVFLVGVVRFIGSG